MHLFQSKYNNNNLLDGVSVVFNDKERVAIIGDNGSGKTTLLRLLAGDLLPDSGTVNKNADVYMLDQINVSDSKSGGEQQMDKIVELHNGQVKVYGGYF